MMARSSWEGFQKRSLTTRAAGQSFLWVSQSITSGFPQNLYAHREASIVGDRRAIWVTNRQVKDQKGIELLGQSSGFLGGSGECFAVRTDANTICVFYAPSATHKDLRDLGGILTPYLKKEKKLPNAAIASELAALLKEAIKKR
jgi:hypothetical protein